MPPPTLPAWLSRDVVGRVRLNAAANTVVRIFDLAKQGLGVNAIAHQLIDEAVPLFETHRERGDFAEWTGKQVTRLLRNEAVLGDETLGYPAVITREAFKAVNDGLTARDTKGRGRQGDGLSNLFSGLAKCGHCGDKMRFVTRKGVDYLQCLDSYSSEKKCTTDPLPYGPIEQIVVTVLFGVAAPPLIAPAHTAADPADLLLSDATAALNRARANTIDFAAETDSTIRALLRANLKQALDEADARIDELHASDARAQDTPVALRLRTLLAFAEYQRTKGKGTSEESAIRAMLREALVRHVDEVYVFSTGSSARHPNALFAIRGPIVQLMKEHGFDGRGWVAFGSDFIEIRRP